MASAILNVPILGASPLPPHRPSLLHNFCSLTITTARTTNSNTKLIRFPIIYCCSEATITTSTASSSESMSPSPAHTASPPPLKKRRKRYRKLCPGEKEGITEEMRFVAMRLRKDKSKIRSNNSDESDDNSEKETEGSDNDDGGADYEDSGGETETWQPSMEGFLKYMVDSKLVFSTIERVVDESQDVSYVYFRKTGLERTESFTKDLEWFRQQNIAIPEASNPGKIYVKYLEEIAEKSPPLFLCHFYNIYFSHIAGGQVIAKQVSERLLEGRELEMCRWERDAEDLMKDVREKLNALGEHWSRDEKTRCLRETTKSFRYLGQIIRLIIL